MVFIGHLRQGKWAEASGDKCGHKILPRVQGEQRRVDEDDGERVGRCELAGVVIETLDLAFLERRSLGHDGQGSRLDRRQGEEGHRGNAQDGGESEFHGNEWS